MGHTEQGSMYLVIPSALITDKRFTPMQKIIIAGILSLSKGGGYCNATEEEIAIMTHTSISSVKKTLKKMEDLGLAGRAYTSPSGQREEHISLNIEGGLL